MTIIYYDMKLIDDVKKLLENADCIIHCATLGRYEGETNGVNILYPEIEGMMNFMDVCEKKGIY